MLKRTQLFQTEVIELEPFIFTQPSAEVLLCGRGTEIFSLVDVLLQTDDPFQDLVIFSCVQVSSSRGLVGVLVTSFSLLVTCYCVTSCFFLCSLC